VKWAPLAPAGFPDEARLHDLIDEAPHMLPLSGSPRLTVVGREVQLGTGYADLLAVEQDGRVAVIEIKLAKNAEARRAVVSQVLAYASYLHGLLERWILLPRLRPDNAGLVTLWNEGGAAIQYWRSVFDRRAPEFISKVEAKLGRPIGQGTTARDFDDELLALLLEAYRVAAKAG
jgi:hypothetical protein